jgi:putative ABC transport system permease protein
MSQMIVLFWKEFFIWMGIAFFISCPISWFVMHRWLQNFAYRTPLYWWIFALAGFAGLCIALATVSWQAYKSARCNPVDALRYE